VDVLGSRFKIPIQIAIILITRNFHAKNRRVTFTNLRFRSIYLSSFKWGGFLRVFYNTTCVILTSEVIAPNDKIYRALHRPRNLDAKLIRGWTTIYLCVRDHTSRSRGTINGNYIFNFYIWILSSGASCCRRPVSLRSDLRVLTIEAAHTHKVDNAFRFFLFFFFRLLRRAEIAEGMDRMVLLAHLITALLHFYYVLHLHSTVRNLFRRISKQFKSYIYPIVLKQFNAKQKYLW